MTGHGIRPLSRTVWVGPPSWDTGLDPRHGHSWGLDPHLLEAGHCRGDKGVPLDRGPAEGGYTMRGLESAVVGNAHILESESVTETCVSETTPLTALGDVWRGEPDYRADSKKSSW